MKRQSRRVFLKTTSAVLIAGILPSIGCDSNEVEFLETPMGPDIDIPPDTPSGEMPLPPITANDRFYLQSVNGQNYDPRLRTEDWGLIIDGLVDSPVSGLRYEEIIAMPLVRQTMTLQCIGNWIGGPLVGSGEWGGTPLRNLLDMAGVRGEAIRAKFHSVDGYTTSVPLERLLREETLLVWEMNGEQLPSKHGYPVRLINPGHYGQKMPKWIERIELIDDEYLGYWESKPEGKPFKWSDDAVAMVNSRIDAPLSHWDDIKDPANGGVMVIPQTIRGTADDAFTIHGIAMAGERTVERVEVSTDGGATWNEARIATRMMPNVWVTWVYEWPLPPSGEYEVVARAMDNQGAWQPAEDKGVDLYDGRTGWHHVPVEVVREEGTS